MRTMSRKEEGVRTPQRQIVAVVIAIGAVAMSLDLFSFLFSHFEWYGFIISGCAGILSYLAASVSLWATSSRITACLACVGLTVLAAVINAPLSFFLIFLIEGGTEGIELSQMIMLALVVGLFFTIPLGLFYATFFATLVYATFNHGCEPSGEGVDRTLRTSGIWLLVVGSLCAVVAALYIEASLFGGVRPHALAVLVASLVVTVAGGIAVLIGHERLKDRHPWIDEAVQEFE